MSFATLTGEVLCTVFLSHASLKSPVRPGRDAARWMNQPTTATG